MFVARCVCSAVVCRALLAVDGGSPAARCTVGRYGGGLGTASGEVRGATACAGVSLRARGAWRCVSHSADFLLALTLCFWGCRASRRRRGVSCRPESACGGEGSATLFASVLRPLARRRRHCEPYVVLRCTRTSHYWSRSPPPAPGAFSLSFTQRSACYAGRLARLTQTPSARRSIRNS